MSALEGQDEGPNGINGSAHPLVADELIPRVAVTGVYVNGGLPSHGNASPEKLIPTNPGWFEQSRRQGKGDIRFWRDIPCWWGDTMLGDLTLHALTEKVCHDVESMLLHEVGTELLEGVSTGHGACLAAASKDVVGIFPKQTTSKAPAIKQGRHKSVHSADQKGVTKSIHVYVLSQN